MTPKKNQSGDRQPFEIKDITEERFSLIFDSLSDAIFILDVEGEDTYRFSFVNRQFLANLGMTRNQVAGARLEDVIPKESVSFVKQQYGQAIRNEENMAWEETIELGAGSKTGIVKVTPIFNDMGKCTQLIGSISDITERKNAEDALKNVISQSLDIISTIDEDGCFVTVSQASKAVWGYEPDELKGEPFMNYVHPEDRQFTGEMAEKIMAGLEITNFENRYVRKDGDTVDMIWSARWNKGDQLMYCIAKDATAIKEAERQAKLRERRFRNLVQEGVDMISIISEEERLIYLSPSHKTLLGYETKELIGVNPFENLIHPDDRHEILKVFRSLDSNKRVKTDTYRIRKKNGDYIRFESTATNMKDDPAIDGVIVNSEDVTESYYYNHLDKLEREILEKNISGCDLPDLLKEYILGIELLHEGVKGSILKVENGKVYNIASPSLPKPLVKAIDGESIGDGAGSCGTAAFTGKKTIVKDARTDERWKSYRQMAEEYKIVSCWSYPIFNAKNEVIATFAVYHPGNREPGSLEENTIERAAQLLRVLFENQRILESLKVSNERYEHVSQATSDAIWDYEPSTGNLFWGGGFKTLFGYDRSDSGKGISRWLDNIHPDDIERIEALVEEMFRGGDTRWDQEYRFKKADGSYSYVRDKAIVVRDDQGTPERVIGAMEDITRKKQEEQRLKLMESVVTSTRDSILITRADSVDAPGGPEIVYVNEAFEKMTGYKAEEVIGKTPRILQGPNTDYEALKTFGQKLRRWEPASAETINYKKNGEEFWINFSVTPVADEKGRYTHWISVDRDVTERKNRELKQTLISEISKVFNATEEANEAVKKTLLALKKIAGFEHVEYWKPSHDHKTINLAVALKEEGKKFYNHDRGVKSFEPGQGLPGKTWNSGKPQYWKNLQKRKTFIRNSAAVVAGLNAGYGFPVKHKGDVVGVLVLAVKETTGKAQYYASILEEVAQNLGSEIHRKELEEELARIFSSAPDIICMAGFDGFYRKVNPAMTELLGYTERELLTTPILYFVHPEDKQKTHHELEALKGGEGSHYFENRHITKSGKVVWLSWTTKPFYKEGITYSVAKDVTEQKELEELLSQANRLAKIGSWEVDLIENRIYWSDMTRLIHEEDREFALDLENGFNYYKEGKPREIIRNAVDQAINNGASWDLELPIITAKGNEKWIRTIGEADRINGKCVRIYGSFQDIHQRKSAEISLKEAFEEKNKILESIGDAFFTVDHNWTVTYWNYMAEEVVDMPREKILGKNFWDVYEDALSLKFYEQYHKAINEQVTVHFEEYYPTLQKWFEVSAYPSDAGLSVYFKDVTERKVSQQKILEKASQLDSIARFNSLLIKEDHWLKALDKCLDMFGRVADTDRVYYFEHHEDEEKGQGLISMRAEWVRDGIKPELNNPAHQNLPLTEVSPISDVVKKGKAYKTIVKDIKNREFREFLQGQEIKSVLSIPVFTGDIFRGFIGFDDCTKERTWRDEEITFLETVAINLSSAIENEDAETAVQQAYEEKMRSWKALAMLFLL